MNVELERALIQYMCKRCGHTWIPRKQQLPKVCPNPGCHSMYWDTERPKQ